MRWLERAALRLARVRRAVRSRDPGFAGRPRDPGFVMHPADPGVAMPGVLDFFMAYAWPGSRPSPAGPGLSAAAAGSARTGTPAAAPATIAAAMRAACLDRSAAVARVTAQRMLRSPRWTR